MSSSQDVSKCLEYHHKLIRTYICCCTRRILYFLS
jgi:hypothetical protein